MTPIATARLVAFRRADGYRREVDDAHRAVRACHWLGRAREQTIVRVSAFERMAFERKEYVMFFVVFFDGFRYDD